MSLADLGYYAAATVCFLVPAICAVYALADWWQRGQADLDRHIDEALAVGNDSPDYSAGIAAFDSLGRSANR